MRRVDREALRRALKTLKENEPDRQHQLKGDWEEVAKFAAYCCQCDALNLKPWQSPPMHMEDDKPRDETPLAGRVAAWELRRRLIAAGLSKFEPDPIRALETVAAGQAWGLAAGNGRSPPHSGLRA